MTMHNQIKYLLSILLLFCISTFLTSCHKNGFTVKGNFTSGKYDICMLDEILPNDIITKDTILLINNTFSYFVPCTEKGFYRIRFSDTVYITFIAGEKDNMQLEGNLSDIKNTQKISGNEESSLFLEVNKKVNEMYLITDSLTKIFVQHKNTDHFDSIRVQLDSCYYYNFNLYRNYLYDFIIQHPNKLASISAFYQKIGYRNFFSSVEDRALLNKMLHELSISYPNNQHVIALKERLKNE